MTAAPLRIRTSVDGRWGRTGEGGGGPPSAFQSRSRCADRLRDVLILHRLHVLRLC